MTANSSFRSKCACAARAFPFAEIALAFGAVLFALAVCGVIMALADLDPFAAYANLWRGAFGSVRNLTETLVRFCPLALSALAVLVGFRTGFFTIGVEGQFYMGALGTTLAALWFPHLPPVVLVSLAMLSGMIFGGLWAALAGYLRIRCGVNEVIGTIMLNFIAVFLVDFLVRGPIKEPGAELHYTAIITKNAWLPMLMERSRLHIGILLPVVAAILVYLFMWRMSSGFSLRVSGMNPIAARHAGINDKRSILLAVTVSGALAGLAGAVEIQGVFHRLQAGIGNDYGYTAISFMLVGKMLPLATLFSALLFAALTVGATMMQLKSAVPVPVVIMLQGLVILFVVGSEAFKTRLFGLLGKNRTQPEALQEHENECPPCDSSGGVLQSEVNL